MKTHCLAINLLYSTGRVHRYTYMNKPYFYIIKHIPSQRYYAGCKYNKKANSVNFMTTNGYQTTSNVVRMLIRQGSIEDFMTLKIRHFNTAGEVLRYEARFLAKVNAATNASFLNKHNGGTNFVNNGGYKLTERTKQKMRKPKSQATIEKQNAEKKQRSSTTYEKMIETRSNRHATWHTPEQIEKIKQHNATWWTDENRLRHSEIMKDSYNRNPISDETREKYRARSRGEKNGMFGKKHSDETREKFRLAWQRRREAKLKASNDTHTQHDTV